MADSLVLKGVKDIRNHTGTEIVYLSNPRGGDTYQLPRWDSPKSPGVNVDCTVFLVTTAAGSTYLAIRQDPSEGVDLKIDHDGSFGFTFSQVNEVRQAALFTDSWELIESYEFQPDPYAPVKVTAGTGSKPSAAAKTIGTVTVTGETSPADSATESYTVSISGDANDTSYALASSDANDTVSGLDVTYSGAGERTLTVTATATASDSPATGTLTVTVA